MAFGTTHASNLLKLVYQATAESLIADNTGTTPITSVYVSLHTASPASGNQQTSEVTYTLYARQAVARSSGGWTVTGAVLTPVAEIVFPTSSSGTPTVTHFATGTVVSATGMVIDVGTVTPNIVVSTSVQQVLSTLSSITYS